MKADTGQMRVEILRQLTFCNRVTNDALDIGRPLPKSLSLPDENRLGIVDELAFVKQDAEYLARMRIPGRFLQYKYPSGAQMSERVVDVLASRGCHHCFHRQLHPFAHCAEQV